MGTCRDVDSVAASSTSPRTLWFGASGAWRIEIGKGDPFTAVTIDTFDAQAASRIDGQAVVDVAAPPTWKRSAGVRSDEALRAAAFDQRGDPRAAADAANLVLVRSSLGRGSPGHATDFSIPGRIRTCNMSFRKGPLYPVSYGDVLTAAKRVSIYDSKAYDQRDRRPRLRQSRASSRLLRRGGPHRASLRASLQA